MKASPKFATAFGTAEVWITNNDRIYHAMILAIFHHIRMKTNNDKISYNRQWQNYILMGQLKYELLDMVCLDMTLAILVHMC